MVASNGSPLRWKLLLYLDATFIWVQRKYGSRPVKILIVNPIMHTKVSKKLQTQLQQRIAKGG